MYQRHHLRPKPFVFENEVEVRTLEMRVSSPSVRILLRPGTTHGLAPTPLETNFGWGPYRRHVDQRQTDCQEHLK